MVIDSLKCMQSYVWHHFNVLATFPSSTIARHSSKHLVGSALTRCNNPPLQQPSSHAQSFLLLVTGARNYKCLRCSDGRKLLSSIRQACGAQHNGRGSMTTYFCSHESARSRRDRHASEHSYTHTHTHTITHHSADHKPQSQQPLWGRVFHRQFFIFHEKDAVYFCAHTRANVSMKRAQRAAGTACTQNAVARTPCRVGALWVVGGRCLSEIRMQNVKMQLHIPVVNPPERACASGSPLGMREWCVMVVVVFAIVMK